MGSRCWLISDGRAGHESIGRGIGSALGLEVEIKRVAPRGLQKRLAPHWPIPASERVGVTGSLFQRPVPEIVFAIGRQTGAYLRAVKRAAPETFAVSLLKGGVGMWQPDLIWAPDHDRVSGANAITTLTSPHRFSADRLEELRAAPPKPIADLPAPRVAVLLGGPSGSVTFDADDIAAFGANLSRFVNGAHSGGLFGESGAPSFMISPSPRTPETLFDAAREATTEARRFIYEGGEPNPYGHMLAMADALIVTGDSISMVSEAVATGRPVFVFRLRKLSPKFQRFLDGVAAVGATRAFDETAPHHTSWSYEPLDPTLHIAAAIRERFARHRAGLRHDA
jgi:mitochondrial fission protein ELM1